MKVKKIAYLIMISTLFITSCGKGSAGPTINVESASNAIVEGGQEKLGEDQVSDNAEEVVSERWCEAYQVFLQDKSNQNELLKAYWDNGFEAVEDTQKKVFGFTLFDIDSDGIPELLMEKVIQDSASETYKGYQGYIFIYKYTPESNTVKECLELRVGGTECNDMGEEFDEFYTRNHGNGLLKEATIYPLGYYPADNFLICVNYDEIERIKGDLSSEVLYYERYEEEMTSDDDSPYVTYEYTDYEQGDISDYNYFKENYKPLWFYEISNENINMIGTNYKDVFYDYNEKECLNDFLKRLSLCNELWGNPWEG